MALQKGKKFDITSVIMAMAGGGIGSIVSDLAEDNIEVLKTNPILASSIPAIVGSAGIFFMDDKWKPAFYGMLGVSGGLLVDDLNIVDGFSRMNHILPSNVPPTAISPSVNEIALADRVISESAGANDLEELEDNEFFS
jgi:hypothetical protein